MGLLQNSGIRVKTLVLQNQWNRPSLLYSDDVAHLQSIIHSTQNTEVSLKKHL